MKKRVMNIIALVAVFVFTVELVLLGVKVLNATDNNYGVEIRLTHNSSFDGYPKATVFNSSIFLTWTTDRTGGGDIYYKTYSNGIWSKDVRLTDNPADDSGARMAVFHEKLYIFWHTNRHGYHDVYYKTFDGKSFSSEFRLTSYYKWDGDPAPVVFNNTLYVFYESSREDTEYWPEIYYMTYDGYDWSNEERITYSPGTHGNALPSSVVFGNKLYLFWIHSSNVYYKTFDGHDWSNATIIPDLGGNNLWVYDVGVNGNFIYVAWSQKHYKSSMSICYKRFNGVEWSEGKLLVSSRAAHQNEDRPALIFFEGDIYVFWESTRDGFFNEEIYYKVGFNLWPIRNNFYLGETHKITILSASAIENYNFNPSLKQINFEVLGPEGITGFCNITIPRNLLEGNPWTITVDRQVPIYFTLTGNTTHNSLYFTYKLADTSHIIIEGTWSLASEPPIVSIISPENKTYSIKDVPLVFNARPRLDVWMHWIGYSLDGAPNVTISSYDWIGYGLSVNTTIIDLSEGVHMITVYANDTIGNMGHSTVYFTIDTKPPYIRILSPKNTTYTTNSVSLSFTVNEATSWMGYSLDEKTNMTITGNITLPGLRVGQHSITVYVNDTTGNIGASEIVYFNIETPRVSANPEPFPTWIVAVVTMIAVLGTAAVFKIRKKS